MTEAEFGTAETAIISHYKQLHSQLPFVSEVVVCLWCESDLNRLRERAGRPTVPLHKTLLYYEAKGAM